LKRIFGFSSLFFFVFLSIVQTGTVSCTKEVTKYDTVKIFHTDTLSIIDTLIIKDTAISLDLLTANSWKVQECKGVLDNFVLFYVRGGVNNTVNYDKDVIRFKADKTGTFTDGNGGQHTITWDFLNTEMTQLSFVVSNPAPLASQVVIWENLRFKNEAILCDQYWTYDRENTHSQLVRIPQQNF
jgi:hypothetical protein